jgi:hypothetical protein
MSLPTIQKNLKYGLDIVSPPPLPTANKAEKPFDCTGGVVTNPMISKENYGPDLPPYIPGDGGGWGQEHNKNHLKHRQENHD